MSYIISYIIYHINVSILRICWCVSSRLYRSEHGADTRNVMGRLFLCSATTGFS